MRRLGFRGNIPETIGFKLIFVAGVWYDMMWYDMMSWTFCPQPPQNQYSINPNNCFIMLSFFPNSVSLGSSAIVKVPEQVGAVKSAWRKVGNRVPGKGLLFEDNPSEQPNPHGRGWEPGSQDEVPKQGSREQVSKQGSQDQVPKQGSQDQVHKQGTGSQARVRRTGSQEQVRVPRTNSLGWFRAVGCQHGSHEHVPKHGFRLLMFPGTASQEQLAKRNFEEHLQARLEARTESWARFRRTG